MDNSNLDVQMSSGLTMPPVSDSDSHRHGVPLTVIQYKQPRSSTGPCWSKASPSSLPVSPRFEHSSTMRRSSRSSEASEPRCRSTPSAPEARGTWSTAIGADTHIRAHAADPRQRSPSARTRRSMWSVTGRRNIRSRWFLSAVGLDIKDVLGCPRRAISSISSGPLVRCTLPVL